MTLPEIGLGRFAPGRTLLHRVDPRTKIVLTLLFMTTLYGVESYPAFSLLVVFILLAALGTGRSLTDSLRGLRPILWLALCAALLNLFFVAGEPLAPSGIFSHLSQEGLHLSAKMVLRLILLVSSASLLTLTTAPLALTDGLAQLLKPLRIIKIPVPQLAMMLTLALRFIPVIVDEAERIIKAQRSRAPAFHNGSLRSRAQSLLPLLMPLFVAVFRRGDALATVMESRCYRGDMQRTRMRPLKFSPADLISSAVMLLFLALLFFVEYSAALAKN